MLIRLKTCALWCTLSLLASAFPAQAEWDWYAGDLIRYDARNTTAVIRERVQQGMDVGLDWLVLAGYARQGVFTGLQQIVKEHDLNAPRMTPILGTGWSASNTEEEALLFMGVDPRAPVPRDSLAQVAAWVESQSGVSIFPPARLPGQFSQSRWYTGAAFLGLYNGIWDPACEPGAEWDRLLTSGHRIFLLAGSSEPHSQKTYVWAENNQPGSVLSSLRRGAAYVAQTNGIQMNIRVNGQTMGGTAPVLSEAYIRLRAVSRHPISRVQVVADGEVIWVARPNSTVWEERIFLPLAGRSYIRAIVESEAGEYRTMSNPIFLVSEIDGPAGEIPLEAPEHLSPSPIFPEIDGALEAISRLSPESQDRILAEFLRDVRMR
ncbi:MAG: hypothetical protein O2954_05355, partial [bacterium]|nr:hypothetical protein [bacterium]